VKNRLIAVVAVTGVLALAGIEGCSSAPTPAVVRPDGVVGGTGAVNLIQGPPDPAHPGCRALIQMVSLQKRQGLPEAMQQWMTWDVPEYQDMQRFVNGPSGAYGPIACIAAAQDLPNKTRADFDNVNGVIVAGIVVNFDAQPVNSSYTRLKIDDPGVAFHCVIIRHTSARRGWFETRLTSEAVPNFRAARGAVGDDGWEGFVVPVVSGSCQIGNARPLPGMRFTIGELGSDQIPAVSRWVIDRGWKPGIGVKCADGWCTLGFERRDLLEPAHRFGASGTPAQVGRRVIPGWYDDQQIAVPGGGPLGISAVLHASVVPDTALDYYHLDDFANWKPVATVHFEDPPTGKYMEKWHFLPGEEVGNLIELRFVVTGSDTTWKVRINGTEYQQFTVRRTSHALPGFHVVGTARWAWADYDEPIWVRCAEGCCWIEPYGASTPSPENELLSSSSGTRRRQTQGTKAKPMH
jgi:hypothetical protein